MIAMIIPINTNTTIATWVQIQKGDIAEAAYRETTAALRRDVRLSYRE